MGLFLLPGGLFLVNRQARDLILCLATLLNSLISLIVFWQNVWGFLHVASLSSANSDSMTLFPVWYSFCFFFLFDYYG